MTAASILGSPLDLADCEGFDDRERVQADAVIAAAPVHHDDPDAVHRYAELVEVNATSLHNFYAGFAMDLDSSGIFVASHVRASRGDRFDLVFIVPGAGRCHASGEVQWTREYNADALDTLPGFGLKLMDLNPEVWRAIEGFFDVRDPIFYEE